MPDGRLSAVVNHCAEEPEAGVGDADEIAAGFEEAEGRQRAEITRRRRHLQPADEFKRPELFLGTANLEFADWTGRDFDRLDRRRAGGGR